MPLKSTNQIQHTLTITIIIVGTAGVCLQGYIPYLNHILDNGSDIVMLSEHWLWPYQLHKLDEIHPDCRGMGNSDSRLSYILRHQNVAAGAVEVLEYYGRNHWM